MIKRASVVLGIVLAGFLSAGELAAQSAPKTTEGAKETVEGSQAKTMEGSAKKTTEGSQAKTMEGSGKKMMSATARTVFLHETFDSFDVGSVPSVDQLQREKLVKVADGGGKVGSGKVAHYNDDSDEDGGAMEYNVGESELSSMYIEFDALNNDTALGDKNSAVIFGVGPWEEGRSLTLNSKSKRAFGFEMYQQKSLRLRVGDESIARVNYDSAAPFNVKIWANDHDGNTFSYKRPDNGETASLKPDSVVVWLNNALMDGLDAAGTPMNKDVTEGNAVIGRAGLSSASTKVANFLFDNLQFAGSVGQSGESTPAAPATPATGDSSSTEATPSSLPGAETISYRDGENAMNLFVYKPEGWKADDKRSAYVFFSAEVGLEGLR